MRLVTIVEPSGVRWPDVCALIIGLHSDGCWRDCMDDVDSAYGLVLSVYFVLAELNASTMDESIEQAGPALCAILDDWLRPDAAYTKEALPEAIEVPKHFFGKDWCDIAMVLAGGTAIDFCTMIVKTSPPFVDGLCPDQVVKAIDIAIDLPDDTGA